MSATENEMATSANTVTIMVGSYLNMAQMISSGVVPSLVADGNIGLDALDYDMAYATYNGVYEHNLVTQLAAAWAGSGSGTQEMAEFAGISSGTVQLTNTTNATIDVSAQGAIFYAADGAAYETEESPTNEAWSNGTDQTGPGFYVVAPGDTVSVPVEGTFQGNDLGSDAPGSISVSSLPGITVSQPNPLTGGDQSETNGDNNQDGWLSSNFGEYSFVFSSQGLSPAEAHVNVDASIAWTPTDVASWESYVDNARSVGILNLAPLESDALPNEDKTQPFATSSFYAGMREAALYGGGLELELPSYYWFALSPSQQMTVIEELRWCNDNGLRSSLLINDQTDSNGDPDPNFAFHTVTMLDDLKEEGALPSQVVFENDNTNDVGFYYDANTTDTTSINAMAVEISQAFSFTPSASEDGLEVKGTSAAQTTLIMTGVRPSEDVVSGSFSPYATTQLFSENPSKLLTLTVKDTTSLLRLSDSLNGASVAAGGMLTFSGTAAEATTYLNDLCAQAASGTVGVADLELTLTDSLGETTEGMTSVFLGNVHPTFTAVTATASAPGVLYIGDSVTFAVTTSAPVTVTGSPELVLTNEEMATYVGENGNGDLLFSYVVKAGDDTDALQVRGLRLQGASISDGGTGLAVDPDSIDVPEEAMANAPVIDTKNDTINSLSDDLPSSGPLASGGSVTFLLGASKPIVDVQGSPTLSLSDSGTATYVGLSNSGQMEFAYNIPFACASSSLTATALNMKGVTITDSLGATVVAPPSMPALSTEISYGTAGVSVLAASTYLVNNVPVFISGAQPLKLTGSLGGQVVTFSDGAEVGIVDPSGTAETLAHLYQAVLGRTPDLGGLEYWTAEVVTGSLSMNQAAADIIGSPEFSQRNGPLTNSQFVDLLSANTGSPSSTDQVALTELSSGTSRSMVAIQFAESTSNVANTLSYSGDPYYGEIYRAYHTAIGQAPNATELQQSASEMLQGMSIQSIVQGILTSGSYLSDFGSLSNLQFMTDLYKNGLNRAPDPSGLQYWLSELGGGVSRANVVVGVSDSSESRMDTSSFTHDGWVALKS